MLWGHSVRASSSTCAMGVGVDTTSGKVGPESAFMVPSDQILFLGVCCLDRLFLTDLMVWGGMECA